MTDWNPSDPDAAKVFYDLTGWDFDQQAELASELADAEIPHTWVGDELVIPAEAEAETDAVFARLELRLGIDAANPDSDDGDIVDAVIVSHELTEGAPVTDYDLTEWADLERELVTESLSASGIEFRFEAGVLTVPTSAESEVDEILDEVETGEMIPVINDGPRGDEVPFESLNSFFLAGNRLRKDPADADGLEHLVEAIKIADPDRPPRGVELRVWRRACQLAEQLADELIDASDDDESEDDGDRENVTAIAEALHDLLRPLI